LRGWLEHRFRALFERETALYREVVANVGAHAGRYRRLSELVAFIESQTASALSLRRVKIALQESEDDSPERNPDASRWIEGLLSRARAAGVNALEEDVLFGEQKYNVAYVLRREDRDAGLLLIEASPNALTPDVRAVLEVLAGQVAIAIEDCRLAEENLRLERKVAAGERLAALGQMAATVAHEVKNPLSAIKSIAQVMSEDEALNSRHARDLSLIVGETDRLSKSVTQLLSFASKQPPAAPPCRADELLRSVNNLFRAEAGDRNITLQCHANVKSELDGVQTAAIRDALSNLVLNALQSTPGGGKVTIESILDKGELIFEVSDTGPGVAAETQAKIWEPFFTTRQRGTGLGLAIVRKRMEEAGGTARLVPSQNGKGARFELRLPVQNRKR
jgi:signal transduction histidine kinase